MAWSLLASILSGRVEAKARVRWQYCTLAIYGLLGGRLGEHLRHGYSIATIATASNKVVVPLFHFSHEYDV